METTIGRLGAQTVTRVGFGAMQLGDTGERGVAILRDAVALGVDHIDTAQFYGAGSVNDLIRTALHPYPEGLRLVTKVGAVHRGDGLVLAQKPDELRAQVEENLARLGVEQLAVVNLRRADAGAGNRASGDQIVDMDSQLAELTALRDAGKIAEIGLSNASRDQVQQALPVGIVCVQNLYNVLDRTHEDVLTLCEEQGVAWVPFFPLGSAFSRFANVADHPVVVEHATRLGITPAQAALAWLLQHSAQTLLIPGTRSHDHLVENMAAGHIELDEAAKTAFDALAN